MKPYPSLVFYHLSPEGMLCQHSRHIGVRIACKDLRGPEMFEDPFKLNVVVALNRFVPPCGYTLCIWPCYYWYPCYCWWWSSAALGSERGSSPEAVVQDC